MEHQPLFGQTLQHELQKRTADRVPSVWLQISEKLKPPPIVTAIMSKLAYVAPKWKIVPTKDIIETGFKEPAKREEVAHPRAHLRTSITHGRDMLRL